MTTSSPGPRTARVALLAVLLAVAGESLLTSGALLDLQLRDGAIPAAIAALVTYVLPGLVVAALVLATRPGSPGRPLGRTVLAGVVVLALARLVLQGLVEMPRYVLGLATVAIAVAVLLLAVVLTAAGGGDRATGARDTASGLVLGLGLFAAIAGATGSWSAVWRHDWLGWVIALGLVGAAGWAAWRLRDGEAPERPRGLWVLGPVLGVGVFALASPAFHASQSQVTPGLHPSAGALPALIALTAWATTNLLQRRGGLSTRMLRLGAALPVLVGLAYVFPEVIGWSPVPVLVVLLATIPATGLLLVAVLGRGTKPTGRFSLAGLGVGVGLGAIVPLLVYQIDYDIPLGFPNALVIVAASLLIVLGSRVWQPSFAVTAIAHRVAPRGAPRSRLDGAIVPATVVVLVSAAGLWASMPFTFTEERAPGSELTVLNWNVHYGVTPEVAVDLEAFARAIEAEDPDVIALQEISRGWLLGAGTDIATWLSHRLQMGVVYGHAADRQFGNALLSRYELTDVAVTQLPYGEGPMRRSAITATVTLTDGTPVRVSSMHLQHKEENTPTRLSQLDAAIADIVPTGPSILAGDLNARPGWPEIAAMEGAGWVSAIDAVGDPEALTFSTWDPVERIDWVFGQHVTFDRAEVMTDTSSDHFGIVVHVIPAQG